MSRGGKGNLNEIKGLLNEYWAEVYRAGRKIHLHGALTVSSFSGAITHELSLGPRDFPVLHIILSECVRDGSDEVDVQKLKKYVAEADRIVEGDEEWKERCGLVKPKARATSGRTRSKYEIENHGSPFAVAGDAKATLRLLQSDKNVKEQKIHAAISAKQSSNGRISRANLKAIVQEFLDASEVEVDDLMSALDPKRINSVNVEIFNKQFLPELMKPKSMRRSVLPVVNEAPPVSDSPRGKPSSSESPRKTKRANLVPSGQTKASKLRVSMGNTMRKYNDADALSSDWIMRRTMSPRATSLAKDGQHDQPSHTTPRQRRNNIPNPPARGATPKSQFKRVNTEVKRDAFVMGNLAQ